MCIPQSSVLRYRKDGHALLLSLASSASQMAAAAASSLIVDASHDRKPVSLPFAVHLHKQRDS